LKIDICIPTFRPDEKLKQLIEKLEQQRTPVNKIILYHTDERATDDFVLQFGPDFLKKHPVVEIHHISINEFDHGGTRNKSKSHCDKDTDIVIFMTQDAIPADEYLTEKLVEPLANGVADISYARQIPAVDSDIAECFTRDFNYPVVDAIKSKKDFEKYGIKTFFCSNVCAAYKIDTFNRFGNFINRTIFNEDMIYAAGVIEGGGKIAYASEARVIHAHHYSNKQQFKRNFDLAVSQVQHPEVFGKVSSESEGIRYVRMAFAYFRKQHKGHKIVPFIITCGYKYVGYKLGYRYRTLSKRFIMKCTMNPHYWDSAEFAKQSSRAKK